MATYIVVDELQFQISLILDDLVLRNDTCRHNVLEGFLVPITSRTTNNRNLAKHQNLFQYTFGMLLIPWQIQPIFYFGAGMVFTNVDDDE
jgi:hypothetical protein